MYNKYIKDILSSEWYPFLSVKDSLIDLQNHLKISKFLKDFLIKYVEKVKKSTVLLLSV